MKLQYGKAGFEHVMQPVSGKAVPVKAGETLHITLLEGPQCVDFNCFNLHDYGEAMSVGHMRRTGFRCRPGSIVWSKPPCYRPMMVFLELPPNCSTDLLAARCHATQFEKERGYPGLHTNCQDTFSEAIGEYGLSPYEVHDSLNIWMNTGWDDAGNFIPNVRRNTGRKGDTVVLLALMDVLAVPIVCGSGDVSNTSNYWTRPVGIAVREATDGTRAVTKKLLARHTGFVNQRTPDQFHVPPRDPDRALRPTGYKPQFVNFPLKIRELELELSEEEMKGLDRLVKIGQGEDREDAFRSAVMTWYTRNRTRQILPESLDIDA
ncbi:MAG TPA: urea carboxylase-associated family protein [Burkholderiales bacterium]